MPELFKLPALRAAKTGLEKDLAALQEIQADVIAGVKRLGTPEARREFSEAGLNDRHIAIAEPAAERAAKIAAEALKNADTTLGNESNWTADNLLRLAPRESIERLRWLEELKLMPHDAFLATVADAQASADRALLYELTLAVAGRNGVDSEKNSLRSAVNAAKFSVPMPDLQEAKEIFGEIKALRMSIASLWEVLQFRRVELRSWVAMQVEQARRQEIKDRLNVSVTGM